MLRRAALVLAMLFVLNLTGCGLLELALLPLKLLFGFVGSTASAVGIADVGAPQGAAPVAANLGGEEWLVTGLAPDVPCTIVCSAPGFEPRAYAWPGDFRRHGERVTVALERRR